MRNWKFFQILLCFLFLGGSGCFPRQVRLPNGYFLKCLNGKSDEICIVNAKGKVVVPPTIDSFWGKYPYLWGWKYAGNAPDSYHLFLFDCESGALYENAEKIHEFGEKNNLDLSFGGGLYQITFANFFRQNDDFIAYRVAAFREQMKP